MITSIFLWLIDTTVKIQVFGLPHCYERKKSIPVIFFYEFHQVSIVCHVQLWNMGVLTEEPEYFQVELIYGNINDQIMEVWDTSPRLHEI